MSMFDGELRSVWYNSWVKRERRFTETDFLSEGATAEDLTWSEEFPHAVFTVRFIDAATCRIRKLLQKKNSRNLSPQEKSNLENYNWSECFSI
jgi:hypothetical protein